MMVLDHLVVEDLLLLRGLVGLQGRSVVEEVVEERAYSELLEEQNVCAPSLQIPCSSI
jgi:hypothetical protein